MSKLTLNNIASGFATNTLLNTNSAAIQVAIENTLSRDGTSPNHMLADLDMNGYSIINESAQGGFGFVWKGTWEAATEYIPNNLVIEAGTTYICRVAHTSSTFSSGLTSEYWEVLAAKGNTGAGTGDMLATNNLSELSSTADTARANISAAQSGVNSDITSLTGLTTALPISEGGTGTTTQQAAINTLTAVTGATAGQVLTKVGSDATWSDAGAGVGDVTGPSSSDAGGLAFFSDTTGTLLNSSSLLIGDVVSLNQGQTLYNKYMDAGCGWVGNTINPPFGGTGQSTYTTGDMLYSNGTNGLAKLPIGTLGQVLTVDSGVPTWATAAGAGLGDVTGPASSVDNSVVTFDGTTGKIIKDGGKALPSGAIVGTTDSQTLTNKTMGSGSIWNGTDIAVADGGTGASTAQAAINTLTAVSAATAGHVLTKVGSDAVWSASATGSGAGNLLSVVDYGATGDGVTNDTTAIQNCINDCFSTGKNMLVPAGTYLVTALTMSSDTYANHFSIFGEGRNKTIIRKYATSSTALLTIGDSTPAIFQANITVEGITFDGLNTTSSAAVRTYDMVRSSFKDCTFMRANVGFAFNGGVANQFYNCMFDACNYGVFMQWVSGMLSQPNETLFNGCQFVNNPLWGLYFTHGALCVLDSCEVEGNGTSGNTSTGGIYVGSLETLAPALVNSQGIIAQNCWFEANSGRASCHFSDGRNTIRDSYFIANPNSTYEIYVSGGTYVVENCSFQNAKTHHLYETAAVSTGNHINAITGSTTFTYSIDTVKTKIDYSASSMVFLRGTGTTAVGTGLLSVTFSTAFAGIPNVQIQILNNDTTNLITSEVYNVTTTGFTVRTKAVSSGSSVVFGASAGIYWLAVY